MVAPTERSRSHAEHAVDAALTHVRRDALALSPGDHVCLVYERDPSEQLPALVPFISDGLDGRERVICVVDDYAIPDFTSDLAAAGIDVASHQASGALVIWSRLHWRPADGLDLAAKARHLRGVIDEALQAGFAGARFTVEMTWVREPDLDCAAVQSWEALINEVLTPGGPARMICQYSRARLPGELIEAALRTHPAAIIGDELHFNPYYDAPLLTAAPESAARPLPRPSLPGRHEWMLERLRHAREFEHARGRQAAGAAPRTLTDTESRAAALSLADDIVALLSHELKTPLTVIGGTVEVLLRQRSKLDDATMHDALLDVATESGRLHRTIDNLLLLMRVRDRPLADPEPVLVGRIASKAAARYSERVPGREIIVHPGSMLKPVWFTPGYLEVVIDNLLSNADKYSPPGTPITVTVTRDDEEVRVSVRDAGPGISPEMAERVFEPFYRTDEAIARTSGAGIGLTICKLLVQSHGGRVWVRPRPEGG
ncbi:MAG TPA: MEDS domain-containing protein, partial [Dehalococcoidia bacterium]|nr:MEDS domain-containing protein [Dehalococcoidia bacterium]